MRPKFVLLVCVVGAAVFAALYLLRSRPGTEADASSLDATRQSGRNASASGTVAVQKGPLSGTAPETESNQTQGLVGRTAQSGSTKHSEPQQTEEYIEQRIGELMDLAMNDDPSSLDQIFAELGNSHPRIREAAVEAVKQFGSTNAIPRLKEAIAQTENTKEKAALAEAIDFLETPSLAALSPNPASPKPRPPTNAGPSIWNRKRSSGASSSGT
jgi:hypothetical protein